MDVFVGHSMGAWGRPMAAAPGLDAKTRALLAFAWADDGRDEHASIAAFARLTMLALSVGAPPDLVVASQSLFSRDDRPQ